MNIAPSCYPSVLHHPLSRFLGTLPLDLRMEQTFPSLPPRCRVCMCVCVSRERDYPQHARNNLSKSVISPVFKSFNMDVGLRVTKPDFILSSLKRNESLTRTTPWMNLEDIMSREVSQTQKDKYWMVHLCELSTVVKFIETERGVVVKVGGCWGI